SPLSRIEVRMPRLVLSLSLLACLALPLAAQDKDKPDPGVLPTDDNGKPLNLDFETGTLKDWTATGDAFDKQPVKGDVVHTRRTRAGATPPNPAATTCTADTRATTGSEATSARATSRPAPSPRSPSPSPTPTPPSSSAAGRTTSPASSCTSPARRSPSIAPAA